jgi:hypothetical protein
LFGIEFRHGVANNAAGIGRGDLMAGKKRFWGHHNTIGNILYGANGCLATGDEDACSYETWLGKDEKAGLHDRGLDRKIGLLGEYAGGYPQRNGNFHDSFHFERAVSNLHDSTKSLLKMQKLAPHGYSHDLVTGASLPA